MAKKLKNHTIDEYQKVLASKESVPGGGSVLALTGASAVGLIVMVVEYSKGKSDSLRVEKKLEKVLNDAKAIQKRFIEIVDEDAIAYKNVVKHWKSPAKEKNAALREARNVQKEVAKLSKKCVDLTPHLVEHGNPHLISDVEVALDLLLSVYNGSQRLIYA